MNKRFFLIPLVILICLTSMVVFASDGAINKEEIQSNSAEDGFGYYVLDEKLGESITISFKDSFRSIQYTETLNLKEKSLSDRHDAYGTVDLYNDNEDNIYMFISGTDIMCAYLEDEIYFDTNELSGYVEDEDESGPIDIPFSINALQAAEAADSFMSSCFSGYPYKYKGIEAGGQEGVFVVSYCFYVGSKMTDDICNVWVRASDGSVGAYSAMNHMRYNDLQDKTIQLDTESEYYTAISDQISPAAKLEDIFLTYNDDGQLVFQAYIYDSDAGELLSYEIPAIVTEDGAN